MAVSRKIKESERHQIGAGLYTDYHLLGIQSLVLFIILGTSNAALLPPSSIIQVNRLKTIYVLYVIFLQKMKRQGHTHWRYFPMT